MNNHSCKERTEKVKEHEIEGVCSVHGEAVRRILANRPSEEHLFEMAELFKVFGDPTRMKILYALLESELCVGDLALLLSMNQSAVSHQLKVLKDASLVRSRRVGKNIYYALSDGHVSTIVSMGMEHVCE